MQGLNALSKEHLVSISVLSKWSQESMSQVYVSTWVHHSTSLHTRVFAVTLHTQFACDIRVWLFLYYYPLQGQPEWFWSWGRSADVYQAGPVETLEKCFAIAQDHCIRGQGFSGIEGVDCFQDGLVRSLTNETVSYYIDVSKPASAKWKRGRTHAPTKAATRSWCWSWRRSTNPQFSFEFEKV